MKERNLPQKKDVAETGEVLCDPSRVTERDKSEHSNSPPGCPKMVPKSKDPKSRHARTRANLSKGAGFGLPGGGGTFFFLLRDTVQRRMRGETLTFRRQKIVRQK